MSDVVLLLLLLLLEMRKELCDRSLFLLGCVCLCARLLVCLFVGCLLNVPASLVYLRDRRACTHAGLLCMYV